MNRKILAIFSCFSLTACTMQAGSFHYNDEVTRNFVNYKYDRTIEGQRVFIPVNEPNGEVLYTTEFGSIAKRQQLVEYNKITTQLDTQGQALQSEALKQLNLAKQMNLTTNGHINDSFTAGLCEKTMSKNTIFDAARIANAKDCIANLKLLINAKKDAENRTALVKNLMNSLSMSGPGVQIINASFADKVRAITGDIYPFGPSLAFDDSRQMHRVTAIVVNFYPYPIKDYVVQCDLLAPSGTKLDSIQFTIYNIVKPQEKQAFGYSFTTHSSQVSSAKCQATNWKN